MKSNQEIISYLKEKGFIFQGSEIYGGLANSWDYGPLGTELKNNIKNLWRKHFIKQSPNTYSFDSSIMLNPKIWKASGHTERFNDPMVDCKSCKERYRVDHLLNSDKLESLEDLSKKVKKMDCPNCKKNNWTDVRNFNLMFETSNSTIGDEEKNIYLRPETAQGMFINFKSILDTYNLKIPFGLAQIGKAFRNEVTPGNFIFRTKEFEQMEIEFFISPSEQTKWFDHFVTEIDEFLKLLNLSEKNIKHHDIPKDSLAHYSSKTIDYEFKYPFGFSELLGLANRQDYDLKNHTKNSNTKLTYKDTANNDEYVPYVIETSMGVERLFYAIICSCLTTITEDEKERTILKLPFSIAPYKVAVMPLTNKLDSEAYKLFEELLKKEIGLITYSKSGTVGKRYRTQDSIGTPFVVTYDFDTVTDNKITIRHRDSMKQERVNISQIEEYVLKNAK